MGLLVLNSVNRWCGGCTLQRRWAIRVLVFFYIGLPQPNNKHQESLRCSYNGHDDTTSHPFALPTGPRDASILKAQRQT